MLRYGIARLFNVDDIIEERFTVSDFNRAIIEEFRTNEGRVGGRFEGRTLLLLHSTGAKSGLPRVNPLAYVKDGDRYVIIASKGGAPTNPDWYYNLLAHPQVSIEVGTEQFDVVAQAADEPERTQLYAKMEAKMPGFTDYKHKTTRVIPVVVLTPTP
jgi:deazaflavin-dependent oxidoreductase (nitroreductase family)